MKREGVRMRPSMVIEWACVCLRYKPMKHLYWAYFGSSTFTCWRDGFIECLQWLVWLLLLSVSLVYIIGVNVIAAAVIDIIVRL